MRDKAMIFAQKKQSNRRPYQDDRRKKGSEREDDHQQSKPRPDDRNQRGGYRTFATRGGRLGRPPVRGCSRAGRPSQPVGSGRFGNNNYRRSRSTDEENSDDDYTDSESSSYTTATSASEERRDEKPSEVEKEDEVSRGKEDDSTNDKPRLSSRSTRSPIRGKTSPRAGARGTGGFGRSRREVERPPRFQKQQERERAGMGRGLSRGVRQSEGRDGGPVRGRGRGRGRGRRDLPPKDLSEGPGIPVTEDWDEELGDSLKEAEPSKSDKSGGRRESAPRRGFSGPWSSSDRPRKDKNRESGGTRNTSSRREPFLVERQQAKVEGSKSASGEPQVRLPAARNMLSKDGSTSSNSKKSDKQQGLVYNAVDNFSTGVVDTRVPPKKPEPATRKSDIQQYNLHNFAGVFVIDDMTDDDSDISSTLSGFVEVASRRTQKENKERLREEEERRKKDEHSSRQRSNQMGGKKNKPAKPPRLSKQHTITTSPPNKSAGFFGKFFSYFLSEANTGVLSDGGNSNASSTNSTKRNSPVNVERPLSPPPLLPVFNAWDKPLIVTPAKPPNTTPTVTSSVPDPLAVRSGKPSSTRPAQMDNTLKGKTAKSTGAQSLSATTGEQNSTDLVSLRGVQESDRQTVKTVEDITAASNDGNEEKDDVKQDSEGRDAKDDSESESSRKDSEPDLNVDSVERNDDTDNLFSTGTLTVDIRERSAADRPDREPSPVSPAFVEMTKKIEVSRKLSEGIPFHAHLMQSPPTWKETLCTSANVSTSIDGMPVVDSSDDVQAPVSIKAQGELDVASSKADSKPTDSTKVVKKPGEQQNVCKVKPQQQQPVKAQQTSATVPQTAEENRQPELNTVSLSQPLLTQDQLLQQQAIPQRLTFPFQLIDLPQRQQAFLQQHTLQQLQQTNQQVTPTFPLTHVQPVNQGRSSSSPLSQGPQDMYPSSSLPGSVYSAGNFQGSQPFVSIAPLPSTTTQSFASSTTRTQTSSLMNVQNQQPKTGSGSVFAPNVTPSACGRCSQNKVEQLQSELEEEKQKTVLFEMRQRDWSRQQENLMEQLTYLQEKLRDKEQQEISLQERLRREEEQKTDLQEQLRQKEQQETSLQERLRQKEDDENNLQEQLRQKEQEETSLQELFRRKEEHETDLQEQLRQKEQQETSLQERLRQKEDDENNLQEQLRQKEQQETSLQERLRQKEEHETDFQEQLREKERQETSLQRHLRGKELEVQELEVALSATQQALNEQRRQEPRDWVINQDEIHATEKRLGTGGWGSVVEGTFRGCKVAVKQIHDLILSPYNRRMFEREMNMASRCRHPCLLQFIGATNDDGSPLLVTELMETSLRALLQQRPLPQTEILTISLDVAQALNYLHLNRPSPIIHRDVSSANVLLWRQGDQWRGKVSDYGTANFMRQTMTTSPGAAIYSAPEAHTSRQTTKVDVYSFGVLLCEMCIREMPDPQRRDEQIALVPSRVLRSLTSRCVHLEPGTRPTMEDIIGEFEQCEASP